MHQWDSGGCVLCCVTYNRQAIGSSQLCVCLCVRVQNVCWILWIRACCTWIKVLGTFAQHREIHIRHVFHLGSYLRAFIWRQRRAEDRNFRSQIVLYNVLYNSSASVSRSVSRWDVRFLKTSVSRKANVRRSNSVVPK